MIAYIFIVIHNHTINEVKANLASFTFFKFLLYSFLLSYVNYFLDSVEMHKDITQIDGELSHAISSFQSIISEK